MNIMDNVAVVEKVSEKSDELHPQSVKIAIHVPSSDKLGNGSLDGGSKRKERGGNYLKLVMEPQNPSPTKYFDNNGIPLRKTQEDNNLPCEVIEADNDEHKRKSSKVTIVCCNCEKTFTSRTSYELHYRTNYQQEPIYACMVCDKRIKQYRAYQLHSYRHINSANQRYTCPDCSKTFHQKSNFTRHRNTHLSSGSGTSKEKNGKEGDAKQQPIACSRCDATFETQAEVKEHSRKLHPIPKQLVDCPDCGKSLSIGSLYSHRKIHSESPKFSCNECGRTFVQKINLIQHHKTHLGERPFQCEQCDKAFCEKAHLQRHLNYHSEERPFRCELCGKCYKTERCLKVHSAVHTDARPFVCPECNKGFLSSSKLRQHSNIHSGLRPFKCKYCTRDFTNFPNWLKHIRRRHKVDHRTGEKLDSVPKFMTKKKDTEGGCKKEARTAGTEPGGEKSRKRTVKPIAPPEVQKDESLPYFSESSNIDLNLVCKDDLLQPLADEMEDIFQCLPSDESKLSIPEPLEQLCATEPSLDCSLLQSEPVCDLGVKNQALQPNVSTELIKHELPSNALTECGDDTISGPLLYDAQLPIFPALLSLCSDEQQFRLINPHFIHLGNTGILAGSSKKPPDSVSMSLSVGDRLK